MCFYLRLYTSLMGGIIYLCACVCVYVIMCVHQLVVRLPKRITIINCIYVGVAESALSEM